MNDRRAFLRRIGLGLGAITLGAEPAAAFFYQKKSMIHRGPRAEPPQIVDFRHAPEDWCSPVRSPGVGGQSFISRTGGLTRAPGPGSIGVFIDGAGEITALAQSCEAPHIPILRTAISYGSARIEMTAFSASHEDEGETDNITILATPGDAPLAVRLVVRTGRRLESSVEEDDDVPRGRVCRVHPEGDRDHPFLIIDADPAVTREGDALVLTVTVPAGGATPPAPIRLRIPGEGGDAGEIISGFGRLEERAAAERTRWQTWKTQRGPAGWDFPGIYGEMSVAGARIVDQLSGPPPAAAAGGGDPRPAADTRAAVPPGKRTDLVDEHFIMESELFLGREKEALARLRAVWMLEDEHGMLIGAGGEENMKEQCAAVYSLCRYAELTGNWAIFDELYPDAFYAMDALRMKREKAGALQDPDANAKRKLLPTGSPGRGWPAAGEELTNSLWALITLKLLLEISDRRFLMKKSETREFYGQLLLAFNTAVKEMMRSDPAGFSWYPMVGAPARDAGSGAVIRPQTGLGTLALGVFPGVLFKKDDFQARDFPAIVKSSLRDGVPAGTGPGPAESVVPVDAVVAAQALVWFMMPEDARSLFVGYLNHASPVYTWNPPMIAREGDTAAGDVDLRASAECIRYLRHIMVLEDEETLRLFEGVGKEDLVPGKRLAIERTPTRWGRVSVALEPVDSRTWRVVYSREPWDVAGGLVPKSIEMPRVLGPNFRFDTIKPGTAIKNGPRVIIDGAMLGWEVFLRDLRRY